MSEHTGDAYRAIAAEYARTVDRRPFNAFYERPAVLSLLPPLAGTRVLDAGCGSGWYDEYLLSRGATVTAFDLNPDLVATTESRVGGRARVLQADLARPLNFVGTGEYDLVICSLVMHYLQDWGPALGEFERVLNPRGMLVFSTHHPFMDWKLFDRSDYFAVELLEDQWDIGPVSFYRRPLTDISEALDAAGFTIDRLLEPKPTDDFKQAQPEEYEKLMRNPWFLCVRARKRV